jgi:hypothetical protein
MERTLLFNFPASLRDVRNWQHLGDVAILGNGRFAPGADVQMPDEGIRRLLQGSSGEAGGKFLARPASLSRHPALIHSILADQSGA